MTRLTQSRARKCIIWCSTPEQAHRAARRVHRLAVAAESREDHILAHDFFTLSTALDERQRALVHSESYRERSKEIWSLVDSLPEVRA